jgi:eukaryotic-like serine/threonine-protein kinase
MDVTTTTAATDELDRRLHVGRPEFGSALDGLRARTLAAAAGGLAPRTIGRYRLGRAIGSGAFGTVYEAEDPELDRRVAIKVLTVRSEKEAARVVREAQLLATLSHPNVVQVFEVGTTGGGRSPYVVMELVEGLTLRKWLSQAPHAWREVVEVVLGVAQGLWAAHQAGIIHRDLKPENVLMGSDGRPRVIDFGLARSLGDAEDEPSGVTLRSGSSSQLTATGQVMGTPAYMAPEVFAGEHTPLSDQYALCVTLYEALFGERPFVAESAEDLCKQVLAREVGRPVDRRGVPRRIAAIALRGLRRAPRERFGDLGALVTALEAGLRPRRWGRLAGAVVGVGGLLVGGIALAGLEDRRPEPVVPDDALLEEPGSTVTPSDPEQAAAIAELAAAAARLRTFVATAKLDAALELSESLLERASALGHAPTLVEVSLLRGQALILATDYEHAVPVLQKAYFLAQDEGLPLGAAHAASELVGVLGYQADQYEDAHRWKEHAEGAFQRAGLDPRQHVPYVFAVAGLASREGDKVGATTMLRAAIAAVERDERANTSAHALLLKSLGRELYTSGDPEAAVVFAREAVAIYAVHDGTHSFTHAAALDNLGVFLTGLGRYEDALVHHREALEIRGAILGPQHIDLGRSYGNMGRVLGKLGRYEEAFAHLDRAIELFTARLGAGNSTVGEAYMIRGELNAERGPAGREDALRDYERAARIHDSAGVIYAQKAERCRQAIRDLGGTPPPAPSIPIPP